jgi:hypothetical protein
LQENNWTARPVRVQLKDKKWFKNIFKVLFTSRKWHGGKCTYSKLTLAHCANAIRKISNVVCGCAAQGAKINKGPGISIFTTILGVPFPVLAEI